MTVKEFRYKVRDYLSGVEIEDSDISVLFEKTLNISKTELVIGNRDVSELEEKMIMLGAERLKNNEPISYIVNFCEFMSLEFFIERGVLIPRKDTEALVEAVIKNADKQKCIDILDMCCGSGCVGISLGKYIKNSNIDMCDISDTAIDVSKKNAKSILKDKAVKVFKCNVLSDKLNDKTEKKYDIVVSNPPYIKSADIDTLENKVKDYEPMLALDGGNDGLLFYERISKIAPLKNGGMLAFEIGYDIADGVCAIMKEAGYQGIKVIKDIENRDRVVLGYR